MKRPVLLIEDSEDDVFLFQHAWQKAGVTRPLAVALDGQKALDYFQALLESPQAAQQLPCLVLLDLKMPRVPGLEVLQWIRHHPRLRTLPVLVLTSSSARLDIESAYQLGANSYFAKPSNSADLLELIKLINQYWLTRCMLPANSILE